MKGYEELKASVERDCNDDGHCGCFNPDGCDKPNGKHNDLRCFRKYCDKFAWVIARAKHYAEKTGLAWEDILDAWESERRYCYQNYYQECNQPRLDSDHVRVFETVAELRGAVDGPEFRCPSCDGISTNPYECNSGRQLKGEVCNWKVYGLFRDLGKGVFVYCKDRLKGNYIFMPVAWEKEGAS